MLQRLGGVHRDTAVALAGNRYGQPDQFARFRAQQVILLTGLGQGLITGQRVRAELADLADAAGQLLAIVLPIEHGMSP